MITPYFPEESSAQYKKYYNDQIGHGIGVFRGATQHRGNGFGNFLGSIFRSTMPLLKSGAKTVGKHLLKAGASVARDAIRGRNIGESAAKNFSEAGGDLIDAAIGGLDSPPPKKRARKGTKRKRSGKNASVFQNVKLAR